MNYSIFEDEHGTKAGYSLVWCLDWTLFCQQRRKASISGMAVVMQRENVLPPPWNVNWDGEKTLPFALVILLAKYTPRMHTHGSRKYTRPLWQVLSKEQSQCRGTSANWSVIYLCIPRVAAEHQVTHINLFIDQRETFLLKRIFRVLGIALAR